MPHELGEVCSPTVGVHASIKEGLMLRLLLIPLTPLVLAGMMLVGVASRLDKQKGGEDE